LTVKNCPNCSVQIEDKYDKCIFCGYRFIDKATSQNDHTTYQQPYAQTQALPTSTYLSSSPPTSPNFQFSFQQQAIINSDNAVMTFEQYLSTFIISAIPVVGFIMLLVWSFGSSTNQNKKNLTRAYLVFQIIITFIAIFFLGVLAAIIIPTVNNAIMSARGQ
jgi:heme/copper-type cytochrome/quinol oxidase subunit 2